MTADLRGTVWSRTAKDILGKPHTSYVRVTDHGPTHAHVAACTDKGALLYTLGRGYTVRHVQLSHEGTRVKGRKRVEVAGTGERVPPAGLSIDDARRITDAIWGGASEVCVCGPKEYCHLDNCQGVDGPLIPCPSVGCQFACDSLAEMDDHVRSGQC